MQCANSEPTYVPRLVKTAFYIALRIFRKYVKGPIVVIGAIQWQTRSVFNSRRWFDCNLCIVTIDGNKSERKIVLGQRSAFGLD